MRLAFFSGLLLPNTRVSPVTRAPSSARKFDETTLLKKWPTVPKNNELANNELYKLYLRYKDCNMGINATLRGLVGLRNNLIKKDEDPNFKCDRFTISDGTLNHSISVTLDDRILDCSPREAS